MWEEGHSESVIERNLHTYCICFLFDIILNELVKELTSLILELKSTQPIGTIFDGIRIGRIFCPSTDLWHRGVNILTLFGSIYS